MIDFKDEQFLLSLAEDLCDSGFCCKLCSRVIAEDTGWKPAVTFGIRDGKADVMVIAFVCGPCINRRGDEVADLVAGDIWGPDVPVRKI